MPTGRRIGNVVRGTLLNKDIKHYGDKIVPAFPERKEHSRDDKHGKVPRSRLLSAESGEGLRIRVPVARLSQ